jgi:hypothetical protein
MADGPLKPFEHLGTDPGMSIKAEEWIFAAAVHNYDFWLNVAQRVCLDPTDGSDIDDFEVMERNIAFIGLRRLLSIALDQDTDTGKEKGPVDPNLLSEYLHQEARQGKVCSEDEIDGVIEFYKKTVADPGFGIAVTPLAKLYLAPWLSRRRARHIGKGSKNMFLDEMVLQGERHADAVSSINDKSDSIILYGKHPRYHEDSGQIQLSTLPTLSRCLGGLFRGDAYMFQAPTGGGKTVLACQLLIDLVNQGYKGLFISTEQPWKEIEPRIISNACSISIGHPSLKNRFDYAAIQGEKSIIHAIDDWERKASGKFAFFHWNADNTQSVKTDLEATLRRGKVLLGQAPDFVILDWIGGALGSDVSSENLRFVYQATADTFAASCLNHQFIGMAFAQSKADKVYHSLGSEQLAECKTMHRKFSALVGVTAITAKEDPSKDGAMVKYETRQFFDIAKSRKGEPAKIPVDRLFEYQTFRERSGIQKL